MSHQSKYCQKLLFIGSGNIANAVACGLANSGSVKASDITVYNRNSNKFERFEKLGINTSLDIVASAKDADVIFLAVKPGIVSNVMKQLAAIEGVLNKALIVSFAASVSIEHIEKSANAELAVIRTMPSTPIMVGEGVLAVTRNQRVTAKQFENFCRMMSSIAHVAVVEEQLMNPIISVQGSSPAYVYLFVKAMMVAAEKQGIDANTALPLILKTIKGSVKMIENSDESIEQLISNVSSPNGTTLAALNSFYNDDFVGSVERAMDACTKRANEISEEL